jgi:opacity protein-like surface antigen
MTAGVVRLAALVVLAASPVDASAQPAAAHLTPFAGYLITGNWYDGPVGTSLHTGNSPVFGVQGSIPLTRGVSLVGNLAYGSGNLRVGLPVLGGVNVGSAKTWMYDAALELGGLNDRGGARFAPFVQAGIGGMTTDIDTRLFDTRATNVAYTAGVGVDVGLTQNFALRLQAKDWISRFNSEDAVGFRAQGNLTHNWALTAGLKLSF